MAQQTEWQDKQRAPNGCASELRVVREGDQYFVEVTQERIGAGLGQKRTYTARHPVDRKFAENMVQEIFA